MTLYQFKLPKQERVPAVVPVVPGLTIPFVAIFSLVLILFIHEFSHGVIAEMYGVRVKSFGILYFLFIPIGAFVEIDDEKLEKLEGVKKFNIFAIASVMNLFTGVITLTLLRVFVTSFHINIPSYALFTNSLISVILWFIILSISIALVNLLPIPGLDGYKMMLALEEMSSNRIVKLLIKNTREILGIIFFLIIVLSFIAIIF